MLKLWITKFCFLLCTCLGFTTVGLYCFHNHTKKQQQQKTLLIWNKSPSVTKMIFSEPLNFHIPCPHKINKIRTFRAIWNLKTNSIPQVKTKCCFALKLSLFFSSKITGNFIGLVKTLHSVIQTFIKHLPHSRFKN